MKEVSTILLIALLTTPKISLSCEIEQHGKLFSNAFLSGNIDLMTEYYKEGTVFTIENDNAEGITGKTATTRTEFKKILNQYIQYHLSRNIPDEVDIEQNKIIYGGSNYLSYHNHWILREIGFKCINNKFKVTKIFLIDGM